MAATGGSPRSRRDSRATTQAGATSSAMISSGRCCPAISASIAATSSVVSSLQVGHQDHRVVEHDLHPLDVGDHVVRQVAAVERHAVDDFEQRLDRAAELDGDDAVVADALQRLRDHVAGELVIGGDDRHGARLGEAAHRAGDAAQRLNGRVGRDLQAVHQLDRVGAAGEALSPCCTIASASTVAVVVPSPATSLVCFDTSRSTCAPMFSNGHASSISRAMLTPSREIIGVPIGRSMMAFIPFGPSVPRTARASLDTPRPNAIRAASSCSIIFAILLPSIFSCLHQNVVIARSACDAAIQAACTSFGLCRPGCHAEAGSQ